MEVIDLVAHVLGPESYTEQLEFSLGLTDAQRRQLNANTIRLALQHGDLITPDSVNPKTHGAEMVTKVHDALRQRQGF